MNYLLCIRVYLLCAVYANWQTQLAINSSFLQDMSKVVEQALIPFKLDFMGKLLDMQQQVECLRTKLNRRRNLKKVGAVCLSLDHDPTLTEF
jgi:hypothetical protein